TRDGHRRCLRWARGPRRRAPLAGRGLRTPDRRGRARDRAPGRPRGDRAGARLHGQGRGRPPGAQPPGRLRRRPSALLAYVRTAAGRIDPRARSPERGGGCLRIWVDCTAAAHPLVMRPLIERLEEAGHEVAVTARAYGQTQGVLERLGIPYESVGRHGGKGATRKAAALARRSASLARWARARRFDLGLGHGSVDLAVVTALLRVPSVQMQDYEHAGLQR